MSFADTERGTRASPSVSCWRRRNRASSLTSTRSRIESRGGGLGGHDDRDDGCADPTASGRGEAGPKEIREDQHWHRFKWGRF
ncbi:unnamed protein product [Linum trigynum]|uniref:Uncharacterized protein n=1 Tax=Linum trigynum TaxID=586398 RepID=A0AAV2E2U4_9ROSI